MQKIKNYFTLLILQLIFTLSACGYSPDFDYKNYGKDIPEITITENKNVITVAPTSGTDTGLIFYPGAYVSYEAYLPLMVKCAQKGIKCILPEMPADLAILKINKATKLMNSKSNSDIKNWYIGGHSLGGAMAAYYADRKQASLKGLILIAAFSTKDLSDSGLKVLSIYGSEDGVLGLKKYKKCLSNLPPDYEEHILEGGNHANFGSYGFQKGDNKATLDSEKQKDLTAEYIANFCK